MYHVGIIRKTIETAHYPLYELSYGGGFRHFYVPAYRLLISSLAITSGIDPVPLSGIMTLIIAVFIILAIYCLAYRIYGNHYIGLCAAFFFIISPELTIFTSRALPELLGLFMIPLTLYFVAIERKSLAILSAILTALTHQMTLLVLALTLLVYAILQLKDRKKSLLALEPLVAACVTYGVWQLYSLHSLNIFSIAQVAYHEGAVVDMLLFARAGIVVIPFSIVGFFWIFFSDVVEKNSKLLILSWFVATLLLTKNDLFGVHIFMDRFFTFLVECMVIFAGSGLFFSLKRLDKHLSKVKT
jgi:hypothetical protein